MCFNDGPSIPVAGRLAGFDRRTNLELLRCMIIISNSFGRPRPTWPMSAGTHGNRRWTDLYCASETLLSPSGPAGWNGDQRSLFQFHCDFEQKSERWQNASSGYDVRDGKSTPNSMLTWVIIWGEIKFGSNAVSSTIPAGKNTGGRLSLVEEL